MAPSMGIFSRRKSPEDKAQRRLLTETPSIKSPESSNRFVSVVGGSDSTLNATRFITASNHIPKSIVAGNYGGGAFGLVHAPALSRPRNTAITPTAEQSFTWLSMNPGIPFYSPRPESSMSGALPSKGKGIYRSKSESTYKLLKGSKGDKVDSRKSAVPVLATAHSQSQLNNFESLPMLPRKTQAPARPPRTPPNWAQDISVSLSSRVGILPKGFPEPLRQFSTDSSPAGSPKSATFSLPYPEGLASNSTSQLQLSPPISPESSMRTQNLANIAPFGILNQNFGDLPTSMHSNGPPSVAPLNVRKKTESDLAMEIAALKKPLTMKNEIIHKLDPTLQSEHSLQNTDLQRMNRALIRRVRHLEKSNNEREEILSRHTSKFQALRQSHRALVETMRIGYEAEIASLKESMQCMDKAKRMNVPDTEELKRLRKREKELMMLMKQRDEELEVARKDTNELWEKLGLVQKLVTRRDGELEVAERRVKRMSERSPIVEKLELRGSEEENVGMAKRLDEEIRLRETAERELDEAVVRYKADLEEALAAERSKAREEQQRVLDKEKGKREQCKVQIWNELEEILQQEEEKRDKAIALAQEEFKSHLEQEEERRAELAAEFNAKFTELEQARKVDLDDFEARLEIKKEAEQALIMQNHELQARVAELQGLLDRDNDAIESLKNSHEDIMRMAKRINERLGEEKKRNKNLESERSMTSLSTYPHLAHTTSIESQLAEEVTQLKQQLLDRDAEVEVLTTELDVLKAELKTVDETWKTLDAEAKGFQEILGGGEKRIRELEEENKRLGETLGMYRKEFDKLTKRASTALEKAAEDGEAALKGSGEDGLIIINSEVLKDLAGHPVPGDADNKECTSPLNLLEQLSQSQSALVEANKEIRLYKFDVKGYRKDVRRRDAQIAHLNKKIAELEYTLHKKSLEIVAVQDELSLERRLPQLQSPELENENIHLLAGKISSVKDENLQLKQRVRVQEDELRKGQEEWEGLRKTLQQYSEQQGLVIADLEVKVERLKGEKEQVERRTRKVAMGKSAELKGYMAPLTSLPLPILPEGEGFAEDVMKAATPPVEGTGLSSSVTIAKQKRRSSHSRKFSGGRTHSNTGSSDRGYAPSPVNTNIPPPQFPSPTTPLPPVPPKSPMFSPQRTSGTIHLRPVTASSDEDFSPLGIMSPLGFGVGAVAHGSPGLLAQKTGSGAGPERSSIIVEPSRALVAAVRESPKSLVGGGGHLKKGSTERKELPKLPEEASEVGEAGRVMSPLGVGRGGGRRAKRVPLSAVVMSREERKTMEMPAGAGAGGGESGSEKGGERDGEEGCQVMFW
ncbi:hypothetical protein EV426DRAFT_711129 [Tirmania nivea]|nr:hypothetical protein EV426DRAFT_711129 [Tirmania nivea]